MISSDCGKPKPLGRKYATIRLAYNFTTKFAMLVVKIWCANCLLCLNVIMANYLHLLIRYNFQAVIIGQFIMNIVEI